MNRHQALQHLTDSPSLVHRRFGSNMVMCFLIFLFIASGCHKRDEKPVFDPSNGHGTYGIDISNHQGTIDWTRVRDQKTRKLSFVYIKATEGATHEDRRYRSNFRQARRAGFLVGSYHYFRTTSDPKEQFLNFRRVADASTQDLIPVVDVEEMDRWSPLTFHRNLGEFLDLVEKHYGVKPLIYTVHSFYNSYLAGRYTDHRFFIARYGRSRPVMKDGHKWSVWQFSESGRVPGIPRPVDLDVLSSTTSLNELLMSEQVAGRP
ncbi:MAG: glycoside hydrolase family 25 protein [Bacteroidota bacterium]